MELQTAIDDELMHAEQLAKIYNKMSDEMKEKNSFYPDKIEEHKQKAAWLEELARIKKAKRCIKKQKIK